jgi:HPt (histidine-containing phosphotransfer) domain-containing protein
MTETNPISVPLQVDDTVTLDEEVIASLRGSRGPAGAATVAKLTDQFLQETTLLVDRITHAAAQKDATLLKAAAHSLAGTAATMGARRLAALGARVARHVDHHRDAGVDASIITAICAELFEVRRALTRLRLPRAGHE